MKLSFTKPNCLKVLTAVLAPFAIALPLATTSLPLLVHQPAQAQEVGTSCEDCPNYSGMYSITNNTNTTLYYAVRWGSKNSWKTMEILPGQTWDHYYPLGENKNTHVPRPYVSFDYIGGDGQHTPTEYSMDFYAVGYAGFGAPENTTQPKRYYFRFDASGTYLDLYAE
jgi:hypothetical protein